MNKEQDLNKSTSGNKFILKRIRQVNILADEINLPQNEKSAFLAGYLFALAGELKGKVKKAKGSREIQDT